MNEIWTTASAANNKIGACFIDLTRMSVMCLPGVRKLEAYATG
jgi:hypothetical protein